MSSVKTVALNPTGQAYMAHAWQFHFGEPGRRGYHNKEWAEKMEAISLLCGSEGCNAARFEHVGT